MYEDRKSWEDVLPEFTAKFRARDVEDPKPEPEVFEGSVVEKPAVSAVEPPPAAADPPPPAHPVESPGAPVPPAPPAPSGVEGSGVEGSPPEPPLRESFDDEQHQDFDDLTETLKGKDRRRMLVLLCKNGRTSVTDLARQLGIRHPTACSHLSRLRGGRLVMKERKSRHQLYGVNPAMVRLDRRVDGMSLQIGRVGGTRVTLEVRRVAAPGIAH